MGSRRLEGRLGNVEAAGNFRVMTNGPDSERNDVRARIGTDRKTNDVRATLQDRIGNQRTASASLSRNRDHTFSVQESRNSQVPINDARRLLEHVSHLENTKKRSRENRSQYEISDRYDRSISPRSRSRSNIQVRLANNKIPDLMDVVARNVPPYERKRKSDYYEEPVRKDMKVVIHQDLDPNLLARETPLRVNLRQDRERSRHLADIAVNEALDRRYDLQSEMESRDRFHEYERGMPYDDVEARYRYISSERRSASLERRMSPQDYMPSDEYFGERERRQRVSDYVDPYYDIYSPARDRYSPVRDAYSPDLGRKREHGYLDRLEFSDRLLPRTTSNVSSYILDPLQTPMRENFSRLRNLDRSRMALEREMGASRLRERELPGTSKPGGRSYPGERYNKAPPKQGAKVPVKTNDKNVEKAEVSGNSISKGLDLRKTIAVKKEETKMETKPQKPVIPKFKQVIDVSLRKCVEEMTPKKRSDFKLQELEVAPSCTDRTLNERFSSIFSAV